MVSKKGYTLTNFGPVLSNRLFLLFPSVAVTPDFGFFLSVCNFKKNNITSFKQVGKYNSDYGRKYGRKYQRLYIDRSEGMSVSLEKGSMHEATCHS